MHESAFLHFASFAAAQHFGLSDALRTLGRLGRLLPFPPMGRVHVNPLFGFGLDPSVCNATARKHQGMRAVPIKNGKFNIAVDRRLRYIFPHSLLLRRDNTPRLDLDQD